MIKATGLTDLDACAVPNARSSVSWIRSSANQKLDQALSDFQPSETRFQTTATQSEHPLMATQFCTRDLTQTHLQSSVSQRTSSYVCMRPQLTHVKAILTDLLTKLVNTKHAPTSTRGQSNYANEENHHHV
jgi:hypothetical protein